MNTTTAPRPTAAPKRPPSKDDYGRRAEAKLAAIREIVAAHYAIDRSLLTGRRRHEPLATIRRVAMHLARELTALPLQKIATSFGRTDHGTVAHAETSIENEMERDGRLRYNVALLKEKIEAAFAELP